MHDSLIFWKINFCPKKWENGPKTGFLNLVKNLALNLYWKIYIVLFAVFLHKSHFKENFYFRYID